MKRTPKTCVNCRRLLTECNRAPCPEKLEKAKAKSFAKAAGAQKSSSSSSPQSSPPSPSKSLSGFHLIGDDSGQHATASGQTPGKKRKKRSSYGPSNPYHYREKGNNHHMGGSSNSSAAGGAGPMGIGNYPNYYPDPSFPWGHGPSGSPDFYPPPPPQYPLFQPPFPNLGPFSALPPKAQPTSSPISIRSVDGKEYNTGNLVAGSNDVGDQDILNLTKKLASSSVSGGASESGGLDLSLFAGSQSILELEGMEKHFHDPNALHNFQVVQLLNNRSQLIGKVHQAVVKNHSEQGIVVDLVVYDNSALGARDPNRTPLLSHEKAKPGPFSLAKFNPNVVDELLEPFLQDYDLYHDLLEPKMSGRKPSIENTHGSRYVIFDVTLFWSHLSTHLKSLSEDLLIDLSSSHIPRLSTFHVYCFGLYSPAMPLIKMATRPNPILSLGPNIKKYFEDFDPTCPVSTTQPTQPSTPTVTISSVTISAPVSVSVSSVSSSPPAAAATGSSPSTSSSPNSDTLLDLSQAIKRKSGIEISVSTEQGLQPKILSVPATNLTHQVAKLVADKRPSNSPRYLIIVDFEATCDFAPRPVVTNQTSEIIEFPWVVLDTKTLEIVHQTRFYIRPDNLDGVTRYCKALTGISRQDCESGIPLREAISIFDEYVKTHMLPNGPNSFRIVTDGVWDLQVQLLQEAARKDIPLEWWYREYFDLKAEYRKTYSWFAFTIQGPPLFVMLQSFGLDFVGRHHSGLDDCKTICQVVRVLLQISPHSFTHAQSIPIDYDPYQDDSWYQFMNHCPVESWQCSDQECLVWNNPRYQACNFCHTPRKKDQ